MRRVQTVILAMVALALIPGATIATATTPEEKASMIGEKWLSLLDDQKYEESWTAAGSMFRSEVMRDKWIAALRRSRLPMGALETRASAKVDFTKTLTAAPDGEYAIIHYTTSFKDKSGVTERLTLVKEEGAWRVAAYAIH